MSPDTRKEPGFVLEVDYLQTGLLTSKVRTSGTTWCIKHIFMASGPPIGKAEPLQNYDMMYGPVG